MAMQLAKGVNLTLIPSKKFKTLSIKIAFKSNLSLKKLTERSLLARILERNSRDYPSQVDLQKALAKLYGASFGTSVGRRGQVHSLYFNMRIVNEQFVQDPDLFEKALQFLKAVILRPNLGPEGFDRQTFEREKANLKDDLESIYDDKGLYAKLKLLDQFFTDPAQSSSLDGRLEDLDQLDNASLYQAYQGMLAQDEIDIVVLGDTNEEFLAKLFSDFNFQDRSRLDLDFYYHQDLPSFQRQEEVQDLIQAKLNLAYQTDVRYLDDQYFTLQVFNALFGGFPGSKLFLNVREKESLAYYASSNLDPFCGGLYVQAGIDQKEADRVIDLIKDQHQALIEGDFSQSSLNQAKAMLKNGLKQSEDSPAGLLNFSYLKQLLAKSITVEEWIEKINQVSAQDVKNLAQDIKLQSIFILRGADRWRK